TGSGIEGNLPPVDLWATLPTLSGCVTERIPGRVMFEHGIEDSEQLAHGGNQRDLGRFTALAQALVKSTQCRLMTDCGQGRHIERGTHLRAAAEDRAWAAPRPALTVERCDSRQGCDLASVEATQLGKASKQGGAGDRPYAWNGAQQRPGRTELGRFTQFEFDSLVDRSKFMLERADSTLDALADRFGHLLAAVTLSDQHSDELAAAVHQGSEFFIGGLRRHVRRRPHPGRKLTQPARVDAVGLGQPSASLGEVIAVARIDPRDRQAGLP